MGMCKKCGEVFSTRDMVEGYCMYCAPADIAHAQKERFIQVDANRKKQAEETRQDKLAIEAIILTTETSLDIPIGSILSVFTTGTIVKIGKDLN